MAKTVRKDSGGDPGGLEVGAVQRVSGPVVTAEGIRPRMYDLVQVGDEKLMGEVIKIVRDRTVIQVYEDTSGIRPGEPVVNTGEPLTVLLGPGLLKSIYDGIQRPLPELVEKMGDFIKRGLSAPGLDLHRKWEFRPTVKPGDRVNPGHVIGEVQESEKITSRILVPPTVKVGSTIESIRGGSFTVEEVIGVLEDGTPLRLAHRWPVRKQRPVNRKLTPDIPLMTGQRILDGLFPLAKGGTAAIPGGFGTGKTVTQHQLAKWSDAEIVVYIGCGERGNEMTEVLTEFPELEDPTTGRPLMERTVLIANTSNMPVAARDASVYTGMTIAEYFRDMGYDVSLMADSTSRWAEAMREISSRLEEMPGEEGYPAYLAERLSEFYERAGRVETLAGSTGSISVIGAVSPPGGDFSEPVTQNTLRIVKVFWALDTNLAHRRHFPAINWLTSYSLYTDRLENWYKSNVSPRWVEGRSKIMEILQKEAELQDIVQLVGSDALPEDQQVELEVARAIREFYLQQHAMDEVDTYCSMDKQFKMIEAIIRFHDLAVRALRAGAAVSEIASIPALEKLAKVKYEAEFDTMFPRVMKDMESDMEGLIKGRRRGGGDEDDDDSPGGG